MVSQDALINAVKKSATFTNEDGSISINSGFTNLQLDNWYLYNLNIYVHNDELLFNCINICFDLIFSGFALSDQTIETIAPYVTNLEILKATGCYRCNDAGMAKFIKKVSKTLRHLDVSNNSRLGQEFITTLVENCGDKLESLKVDHSLQISGKMIKELARFRKLLHLSISHVQDIADEDISVVLEGIGSQLRGISFSGCYQLTDLTLVNIRKHCREVQEIDLSSVPNFTKIGYSFSYLRMKLSTFSHSIIQNMHRSNGFVHGVQG